MLYFIFLVIIKPTVLAKPSLLLIFVIEVESPSNSIWFSILLNVVKSSSTGFPLLSTSSAVKIASHTNIKGIY